MTYELAKELKEAGFPQTDFNQPICRTKEAGPFGVHRPILDGEVKLPTLSELIEACGQNFAHLEQGNHPDQWRCNWDADFYSTPEEAVARLWLALNKP
jgi:hypothetical protein